MPVRFSDIFKIGIGPSSSHTMGPMIAAADFIKKLASLPQHNIARLSVHLYGSLAFTGKGHATDKAIMLGLCGFTPETITPDQIDDIIQKIYISQILTSEKLGQLNFSPDQDLIFEYGSTLPEHPNGMIFHSYDEHGHLLSQETYFSIGGGFILTRDEIASASKGLLPERKTYPYPFATAAQMLEMGHQSGLTIASMMTFNELTDTSEDELDRKIDRIWQVMNGAIERGLSREGELPGGLKVKRRARKLYGQLNAERFSNSAPNYAVNEWLSVFAMAVNEENAAGGQIVTAPTNGAAGVIPSVIRYYQDFCPGSSKEGIQIFLLTAAAIGGIIKTNASISGAEVGCQGEVGSASAMAAAGLCAALGGTNEQIENAAEIALEHHLGMTCDPVKGLVQVPCIERNGIGAVKAVTAASLALRGDGTHIVPLDNCIETMRQTGLDMSSKYKETSLGGLAVNRPEC